MRKTKKTSAIILSVLMALQTPAMAGELVVEEAPVQEEIAAEIAPVQEEIATEAVPAQEEIFVEAAPVQQEIIAEEVAIEEELPEEVMIEEQLPEEIAPEIIAEEGVLDDGLLEEPTEDSLIPEDTFEEQPAEEPVEIITEEIPAEEISTASSEEEGLIEEELPAVGAAATSGQCGDNVSWTLDDDGVLTISGTGEMWGWDIDYDTFEYNTPWQESRGTIKKIIIGAGITSIGNHAFHGCSSLTDLTIPDSVVSLGDGAFYGCSTLTGIAIGDNVTSIGEWTFNNCGALTNVTIGDSVTTIDEYAFCNCNSLLSLAIPDSVTGIGMCAFESCSSLTDVILPESITSIEAHTFYNCNALKSVTIPKSVTKIGLNAFYKCDSLTSVTFEGDAPEINASAFTDTTTTAYYPADNSTWLSSVRKNYGGNITWVSTGEETPPQCGDNAFWKFDGDGVLTVFGTGDMWEWKWNNDIGDYDIPWLKLKGKIKKVIIEPGITNIQSWAFEGCSALTSVTIADTVTSIGSAAFEDCRTLTSVTIPDSVTSIGEYVFEGCFALKSITIPDSVTNIADWTFNDCRSLTDVKIPDSVTYIGRNAFCYCGALTSVSIPNSVENIGNLAFGFCSSLTDITIPDSVTNIEDHAFYECTALTTIKFEGNAPAFPFNTMNADQSWAFYNVTATAYYPAGNPTWTEAVMQDYGGTITWKPYGLIDGKVTANNFVRNASTTAQTFYIGAKRLGTGKLTYSVNSKYVTVDESGKVTIPAYYMGKPTITIKAAASGIYKEASKKILVTINRISGKVTANSIVLNANASTTPTKKITVTSQLGRGKLTYSSNNSSVKVDSTGKVTVAKNYAGTATITIKADAWGIYNAASTSIKVTVKKIDGKITASNFVKNAFPYEKYFYIGAKSLGNARMTYRSNSQRVTVDSKGKVTIPRNYAGIVTIRIYANAAGIYKSAFRKITVTIRPQVPAISGVCNSACGRMTAKWERCLSATGYVLQYAANSNFTECVRNIVISDNRIQAKDICGLIHCKTYYVRLRSYRTVGGNTLYSSWSEVKTVKIIQ